MKENEMKENEMNKYFPCINKSVLFCGIRDGEMESVLQCLTAQYSNYKKGEFILRNGESVSHVGMVLSGMVHIIKEDFWGNRSILSEILPGQLFAESYACLQTEVLLVDVIAVEPCDVLFLDIKKIWKVCTNACTFHTRLIQNLLVTLAQKNQLLTRKMEHITKRSTREKLLSYLSSQSLKCSSASFEIPFNRQQLADYLSVDRSAMSGELCKLRDEGVLEFTKNYFVLTEFHKKRFSLYNR